MTGETAIDQGEAEDLFDEGEDELFGSEEDEGQSLEETDEEPDENQESSEEEFSPESKSYKEIQRAYTQSTTHARELEERLESMERQSSHYGGVDKMAEMIQYATSNPEISEAIKRVQQQEIAGVNVHEMDDEGKKAVEMVEKIAQSIVDKSLQSYQTNEIDPIIDSHRVDRVEKLMGQMDDKYGDRWADSLDAMKKVSESLPRNVLINPSFDDMEDLFFKALRTEGRFDEFMGETYQEQVKEKRQRSVSKPRTTSSSSPKGSKPKDMFEAATRAAKRMGI
jgi:hypothetical protein|tara:strand:- start:210 stop:1052 length:843 start_codon:yes stop_codon:yes gene_type:complete